MVIFRYFDNVFVNRIVFCGNNNNFYSDSTVNFKKKKKKKKLLLKSIMIKNTNHM